MEVSRSRRRKGLIVLAWDESYLGTSVIGGNGRFSCSSPPGTIIPVSPLKGDFGKAATARKHSSALGLLGVVACSAEPPVGTARPIHHTLCRVTLLAILALLRWPLHQNRTKSDWRRDPAARDEDASGR